MSINKQVTRQTIISHLKKEKVVTTSKTSYDLYIRERPKEGGNGFVLKAWDENGGIKVALKFYLPRNPYVAAGYR